jgi:hypothetical protein
MLGHVNPDSFLCLRISPSLPESMPTWFRSVQSQPASSSWCSVIVSDTSAGNRLASWYVVCFNLLCQGLIVVLKVAQTALIGSLASIGVNDRAQAIATIIVLAATITPPQLLSFAMISMGIENQVDMYANVLSWILQRDNRSQRTCQRTG